MELKHFDYNLLSAKQRKQYNFQKVSALLADYGFACLKLDDSLEDADFLAKQFDGKNVLRIVIKGRLLFDRNYIDKRIFVVFPYNNYWYLIDHDATLKIFLEEYKNAMAKSISWDQEGLYSWPALSVKNLKILEPYKLKPKND